MKVLHLLNLELKKLIKDRYAEILFLFTAVSPLFGYSFYKESYAETVNDKFLLNPCLSSAVFGSIAFAFLTIIQFSRADKYSINVLEDSSVSPIFLSYIKLFSVIISAVFTVIITAIVYFPYIYIKLGSLFKIENYLYCFFLIFLCSVIISVLCCASLYNIFHNIYLSILIFIVFSVPNFMHFIPNHIFYWMKPYAAALSDYFGNDILYRVLIGNRLIYITLFVSIFIFSTLFIRQFYGHFRLSFIHNIKKIYIPVLGAAFMCLCVYSYRNQPYVYSGQYHLEYRDIKEDDDLICTSQSVNFKADTATGCAYYKVNCSIKNTSTEVKKCILRSTEYLNIKNIKVNDSKADFKDLFNDGIIIEVCIPSGDDINLSFECDGKIKTYQMVSAVYYGDNVSDKNITVRSCPFSLMNVKFDKDSFIQMTAQIPDNLNPFEYQIKKKTGIEKDDTDKDTERKVFNQNLQNHDENSKTNTWSVKAYTEDFTFEAGEFEKTSIGTSDMPIDLYCSKNFHKDIGSSRFLDTINYAVNYCRSHYGKLYSVNEYNPLVVSESSACLYGGFALSNYSTIGETCFTDEREKDASNLNDASEVLSHELAHQWFGAINVKDESAEGFAVYTTYRIMKQSEGEDAAKKHYIDVWKQRAQNYYKNFYAENEQYIKRVPKKCQDKIYADKRVIFQYSIRPLQILKASEIVGEEKVDEVLCSLYEKSISSPITFDDFLESCNLTKEDVDIHEYI